MQSEQNSQRDETEQSPPAAQQGATQQPPTTKESDSQPKLYEPVFPAIDKPRRRWPLVTVIVLLVILISLVSYLIFRPAKAGQAASSTPPTATSQTPKVSTGQSTAEGLQLDPKKNYGDKYADGVLPVGDSQYVTDKATKGKIYTCNANYVPASQAGAQTRGPWFVGTTQWNVNKKSAVQGNVKWQQGVKVTVNGATRIITTNDLPDHSTGVFPVASSDPAYQYDRNPNTIKAQSLAYGLPAGPNYGTPQCMGGEVGVMLTGVALFNGFDAGARDAGAWEVQDGCQGHPQGSGIYHYHTLSSCIKNIGVGDVIGFALDGFPITGPRVGDKNILTTSDLDECHGISSDYTLDGKKTHGYHYVMTQDFPYSASCFRAKAIQSPAQHSAGQSGTDSGGMSGPGGQARRPPQGPPPQP